MRRLLSHHHRVKFHNIIYITEGEGTHYIDFKPYAFSPGSLLFISQEQVQAFDVRSDIRGYLLLFTNEYLKTNLIHSDVLFLYRLYNYHLHTPVMEPQETVTESMSNLFKEMKKEYDYPDQFAKDEILRLFLKTFLLKAERIKRTVISEQKNTEWFIKYVDFKECLTSHYMETRSVKEYAKKLKISPKHLNIICKSLSGVTAKQCIDNFMVLEMKRVLVTSDDSVQEISYSFGFDEPTNFVKYFKKHSDQSPAQFRKTFTSVKPDYH